MLSLTLGEAAAATSGRIIGSPEIVVGSVSTDSREIEPGALFVALRGPTYDGHHFVRAAAERGAVAAVISDESASAGGAALVVDDTLAALQSLAAWHRRRFDIPLLGLTGSAGKTTTKELTAAILERVGPTLWTRGNLNNHIGVPLTLLRLEAELRAAVIEMGCNHHGEIAALAAIAAPTAGLITNVSEAHLEGLGDLDGVARAKGELFAALGPSHSAVVNLDDPRVRSIPTAAGRKLGYGAAADAEVRLLERAPHGAGGQALRLALGADRTVDVHLKLLGEHNARNALAAAALALTGGAGPDDVVAGLERCGPAPRRLELLDGPRGMLVIDDSYNANPGSMIAALDVLVEQRRPGGRAHALLGEMLELGADGRAQHRRVGRHAAAAGVDTLIGVGAVADDYARGYSGGASTFLAAATPEEAAAELLRVAGPDDVVLVKGSRGSRMDRAVDALGATKPERGA